MSCSKYHTIKVSMLDFLGVLQTGQTCRKGSQVLHEQRCLQGRNIKHDFWELQHLQSIVFFLISSSSPTPPRHTLFSPVPVPSPIDIVIPTLSSQHDSASSDVIRCTALSFICSKLLWRHNTMASFSSATFLHDSFSTSNLLKNSFNSLVLFVASTISSSFCLSKWRAFNSIFFNNSAICCFLCSCSKTLNFSFWTNTKQTPIRLVVIQT